jgi:hypothetical protein
MADEVAGYLMMFHGVRYVGMRAEWMVVQSCIVGYILDFFVWSKGQKIKTNRAGMWRVKGLVKSRDEE